MTETETVRKMHFFCFSNYRQKKEKFLAEIDLFIAMVNFNLSDIGQMSDRLLLIAMWTFSVDCFRSTLLWTILDEEAIQWESVCDTTNDDF